MFFLSCLTERMEPFLIMSMPFRCTPAAAFLKHGCPSGFTWSSLLCASGVKQQAIRCSGACVATIARQQERVTHHLLPGRQQERVKYRPYTFVSLQHSGMSVSVDFTQYV